ncbi:GNAT family N-acetyltransferase [Nonomuraea sp. NPDC050556]|uniref:GNAT family N-acetyltransferase n=1 Tax=Nonomuraea sp. NPDC050556 TaxID=3364369 RepID=UPI0037A13634
MFPREVIATGSLVLRPPAPHDADAIIRANADPVTRRFLTLLPVPYTLDDAHDYLKLAEAKWANGGAEFTITDATTGEYLGTVGVQPPDRWGSLEIGYALAPWARGKGVATAAVRAVTQWAFDHGVHRVVLIAEVENVPSLKVAYGAGFVQEGVQREAKVLRDGRRADWVVFARLATDAGLASAPYLPVFDELTDGVVRLEPITAADSGDFYAMLQDPVVDRYRFGPAPTEADIERRCRYTGYWWVSGQRIELAVRDAGSGAFAGHLQLMQVVQALDQAMVGYSLVPEFRGKGFMTRAVRLLVDWAFDNTSLHRILAGTDASNTASHQVLERAGFERVATHRELFPQPDGSWTDDVEWLRLRPQKG